MTEQDDTMAADVQNSENSEKNDHTTASAAGADADTTWVPADPATVDAYAWGTEPSDDELNERLAPPLRHPWTRVLAIAAGVLALGTVAAVVVAVNGRHGNDLHGSALPVTVHSSAAAPVLSAPVMPDIHHVGPAPAPATTAAAVPSIVLTQPTTTTTEAAAVPEFTAERDQWFVDKFGAWYRTRHGNDFNTENVVGRAHRYCMLLSEGETVDQADEQVLAGVDHDDVEQLTAWAAAAYPNCGHA
jgi:hypothetical protein